MITLGSADVVHGALAKLSANGVVCFARCFIEANIRDVECVLIAIRSDITIDYPATVCLQMECTIVGWRMGVDMDSHYPDCGHSSQLRWAL